MPLQSVRLSVVERLRTLSNLKDLCELCEFRFAKGGVQSERAAHDTKRALHQNDTRHGLCEATCDKRAPYLRSSTDVGLPLSLGLLFHHSHD